MSAAACRPSQLARWPASAPSRCARRGRLQQPAAAARRCSVPAATAARDAVASPQPREQPLADQPAGASPSSSHGLWRAYPHINRRYPGLELVHAEPPVYVCHGFLPPADCAALRGAAAVGQLPQIQYDQAVLVDVHRLWPLLLVVGAGAGFDAWHGAGAGATADALAAAAAPALLKWAAAVGGLLAAALAAMTSLAGGRVFTGTKWTAAGVDAAHRAAPAFSRFLHSLSCLLEVPTDRLEPPTVTWYRRGQYQRIHFDARPQGDPAGLAEFLAAGGQRLVQCVVYLNSLEPGQGGGTHFFHPLLEGLTVQPREGDALLFFPAFADGRFDERMAHAGQPVSHGEKWCVNTWCCQRTIPTAVTHLPPPPPPPPEEAAGGQRLASPQ